MSLIMFMETNTGLVISGDSRLSRKDNIHWHRDDAEKVFNCKDIAGIAYHGEANIDGVPMDVIIRDFISTIDENDSIYQILCKMRTYIKKLGKPESKFYILGYENSKKIIYQFSAWDDNVQDLSDGIHGTGGRDDIAWGVLKGKYNIHRTNEEATDLIDRIYRDTVKIVDSVGGPIDILFISSQGTMEWIRHK